MAMKIFLLKQAMFQAGTHLITEEKTECQEHTGMRTNNVNCRLSEGSPRAREIGLSLDLDHK